MHVCVRVPSFYRRLVYCTTRCYCVLFYIYSVYTILKHRNKTESGERKPEAALRLFLSYGRGPKVTPFARWLKKQLQDAGYFVWMVSQQHVHCAKKCFQYIYNKYVQQF